MILEICMLLVACAGALWGTWSPATRDTKKATIATAITVTGLTLAIGSTLWKSIDSRRQAETAAQERSATFRTVLANSPLDSLKVSWSFDRVPKSVLDIFTIGDLMVDTRFLNDEEVDRMPQDIRSLAAASWHLDDTVAPLIFAIEQGGIDPKVAYKGEGADAAIQRWSKKKDEWVDQMGSNISFAGPAYDVLIPLNLQSTAVLSLGRRSDDVALSAPKYPWQEDQRNLFADTNYGFKAEAKQRTAGFEVTWTYDKASLQRAVERVDGAKISAALPDAFNIVVVKRQLRRGDYLSKAAEQLSSQLHSVPDAANAAWDQKSALEIFVNELPKPRYRFEVRKVGTFPYAPHRGAYDAPETEYEYTLFRCKLLSLG